MPDTLDPTRQPSPAELITLDMTPEAAARLLKVLEHHYAYVTVNAQPVTDLIGNLQAALDAVPM